MWDWSGALAGLALTVMVKGTVLAAAAATASWSLRRRAAAWRHLIWGLAFAGLILLFLLPPWLPQWGIPVLPGPAAEVLQPLTATTPAAHTGNPAAGAALLGLWLAGCLWHWVRLAVDFARLARETDAAARPPQRWFPVLAECRARLGLRRDPRVVVSPASVVPMAWGLGRGTVILPAAAHTWSGERLRLVLLHEFAHIRRRDLVITVLAQLVCAAYWPNPAIWAAARRMARVREEACDETVLRTGADRLRYAEHLLAIARGLLPAGRTSVAMSGSFGLAARIRAILGAQRPQDPPAAHCKACLTALAGSIVVPLAAAGLVEGSPTAPPVPEPPAAIEDIDCRQ